LKANALNPEPELGSLRRAIAMTLGVVTVLCALLWFLTFAFIVAQSIAGVYDSPFLALGILALTFPPALFCTTIAIILVGPRHCKLAWIALCIYVAPLVVSFSAILLTILWNTIKGVF
jgi:hypothetical protein